MTYFTHSFTTHAVLPSPLSLTVCWCGFCSALIKTRYLGISFTVCLGFMDGKNKESHLLFLRFSLVPSLKPIHFPFPLQLFLQLFLYFYLSFFSSYPNATLLPAGVLLLYSEEHEIVFLYLSLALYFPLYRFGWGLRYLGSSKGSL